MMKVEDCKVGMKVKVIKNTVDNDAILGAKGVISWIGKRHKEVRLRFLSDVNKFWTDDRGYKAWYVFPDCIEPIKNETNLINC